MNVYMELSEREYWVTQRKRKKIRLWQIAEQIGCSVPLLSQFENGKCNIDYFSEQIYKQIINQ